MTPIGIIDQSEYDKLNEFAESEKGKISRIEKELNNLEGERSEITTRKEQLKKQGEISDALYRRTLKLRFDYFDEVRAGAAENKSLDSELKAMLDKSHADATALEAEVKVLEDRISQIEKRSQDLKNSIIASKLNLSNRIGEEVRKSTNTETNSDGAYSMSIPSPDVFLVAAAERSLGGEIEYYGWLLKADSGRLVLNNGNLFYSWSIPKE
jgi:DNA repair exonuclease SbcCD ATPase subunit